MVNLADHAILKVESLAQRLEGEPRPGGELGRVVLGDGVEEAVLYSRRCVTPAHPGTAR